MYPSKEHLGRYRIFITTLVPAGRSEDLRLSPSPMMGGPRGLLCTQAVRAETGEQQGQGAEEGGQGGTPPLWEDEGEGEGRKAGQLGQGC